MAPDFVSVENALKEPAVWLEKLARQAASLYGKGGATSMPSAAH